MKPKKFGSPWGALILCIGALIAMTLAWRCTPLSELLRVERVTGWVTAFSSVWWAPLVILAAYTPASLIMFPRPLITLAAAAAFGPWLGFTYAMSGILIAALASYLVGIMLDPGTMRRISGATLNRVSQVMCKRGLLAVTAMRLVSIAPFAVEGVIAGAMRVKLWHFVLGTFAGMLPGALAATLFGDQLEAALREPRGLNYWLLAGITAALVVGALIVYRWLFKPNLPGSAHAQG